MNWYLKVLSDYAVFEGRARRKEYWMFLLFTMIISFVIGLTSALLRLGHLPGTIYSLATLVPSIAVGVRRMHDIGRSGWWILLPIVNIVFACLDSQPGDNDYGPNPKEGPLDDEP